MIAPLRFAALLLVTATAACVGPRVADAGAAHGCYEAARIGAASPAALNLCDRALARSGLAVADRAATLVNRGILHLRIGDLKAALGDYDAAIIARPDSADAWVNKGVVLIEIGGRDAEAVTALSEGIARNPARPEIAYYHRAIAYEALGRAREAFEDYSRAAQLAPQWAEPAEQLQRFQTVRRKTLTA